VSQDNEKEPVRSGDPIAELLKLLELAAKYPEIGPPLAELAYKIGHGELAERVVRMGLERATPGVEFYFVAANAARRERKWSEALRHTLEAVKSYAAGNDAELPADEGSRLLHLIRQAFAMLMFDVSDVRSDAAFVAGLVETLPGLEARLGGSPFYHVLLAQVRWYEDKEASEKEWARAVELGEHEHTFNARGTWYKEADHDVDAAEKAYRDGLEHAPHSALLLHNLAQILVEKAARPDVDVGHARHMLKEADDLVRGALREDGPKGLRRHVHATRDRLNDLRQKLPRSGRGQGRPQNEAVDDNIGNVAAPGEQPQARPPRGERGERGDRGDRGERQERAPREPVEEEKLPEVGAVVKGRVQSLTAYGAFVAIGRRIVGLLHKSELAYEHVNDPAQLVNVGDEVEVKVIEIQQPEGGGRPRIGLSRKALLPAPVNVAPPPRQNDRRGPPQGQQQRGGGGGGGERHDRGGGGGGGGRRDDRRDDRRGPAPAQAQQPKGDKFLTGGRVSLGEMLLAKIKESGGGNS
jgi:S1 RNA binding domain protein